MKIYPAIDIRGGKCVRLFKGDFAQETVFSDSPAAMAKQWAAQGAEYLHLVDLDGARAGRSENLTTTSPSNSAAASARWRTSTRC